MSLMTSELQFGFKEHYSTIMCSTLLVETVFVYVLLIDASKVFDRRIIENIYSHSEMHVQWNSAHSLPLSLHNGVNQGGVLSPILFSIYIDSLLQKLKDSGLCCHVSRTFADAFAHAYDLTLVSPSLSGLRQMI